MSIDLYILIITSFSEVNFLKSRFLTFKNSTSFEISLDYFLTSSFISNFCIKMSFCQQNQSTSSGKYSAIWPIPRSCRPKPSGRVLSTATTHSSRTISRPVRPASRGTRSSSRCTRTCCSTRKSQTRGRSFSPCSASETLSRYLYYLKIV